MDKNFFSFLSVDSAGFIAHYTGVIDIMSINDRLRASDDLLFHAAALRLELKDLS